MSILNWNCWGLGNPRTVWDLHCFVKSKKPGVVFLMETKMRMNKMELIKFKMGFQNMFVVDCVRRSGGLVLFWKDDIEVEIQNFSRRHINAKMTTFAIDV